MNRIISINIKGLVFQIEEDAFEMLNQYLERLKSHFRNTEGADEILEDIEARIAEIFLQSPGPNGCVSITHVEEVLKIMGNPSDFESDSDDEPIHSKTTENSGNKRKLFRDTENKMVGGVCAGLGAYLDIDPLWIRLGFALTFLGFGTGLILYLILWAIIPEARSRAEKLSMRGEKVTIESIEKTVQEEFERLKKNLNNSGVKEGVKDMVNSTGTIAGKGIHLLARLIIKAAGIALIALSIFFIVTLLGIYFGLITDVFPSPFFPFFSMLFQSPLIAIFFRISLLLLTIIPVIGLLYAGIRMLLNSLPKNPWISRVLSSLWVLSLIFTVVMVFYLAENFRDNATLSQEIEIQQADTLYISSANQKLFDQTRFNLEFGRTRGMRGIYGFENDTLKRPIKLDIHPVNTQKISMTQHKTSNGGSYDEAVLLAENIEHNLTTSGNHLIFNPYYSVSDKQVWRNQQVNYQLEIPIGTVIVFEKNTATFLNHISMDNPVNNRRLEGKAFVMTKEGLQIDESTKWEGKSYYNWTNTDFSSIAVSGISKVEFYQSSNYRIELVEGDEYNIIVNQSGTHLSIENKQPIRNNEAAIRIGVPDPEKIELNGNMETLFSLHQNSELKVELNGAVQIKGKIIASSLTIESNGMNTGEIEGNTDKLNTEMNGGGVLDFSNLVSQKCDIEINGGSKISVNAVQHLQAEANGASIIQYKGNPQSKTIEVNGMSKITPIEN